MTGESEFKGIKIDTKGELSDLIVDGVFVAIGQVPENEQYRNLVTLNDRGYIVSDEACLTDTTGLYVAGDCRTKGVRQISTACADGATAAHYIEQYIAQNQ